MGKRCISNENLSTTGFSYTLSLINGKYKMTILYTLMEFGVVRFNEIKKYIGQISYKTLSSTLKELEADQLVHKNAELHTKRTGSRSACPQRGISPDSAQSRVQPDRKREIADPYPGRNVRMGRQKPALISRFLT